MSNVFHIITLDERYWHVQDALTFHGAPHG